MLTEGLSDALSDIVAIKFQIAFTPKGLSEYHTIDFTYWGSLHFWKSALQLGCIFVK